MARHRRSVGRAERFVADSTEILAVQRPLLEPANLSVRHAVKFVNIFVRGQFSDKDDIQICCLALVAAVRYGFTQFAHDVAGVCHADETWIVVCCRHVAFQVGGVRGCGRWSYGIGLWEWWVFYVNSLPATAWQVNDTFSTCQNK